MAHKQRANKSYDLSITKVYCGVIVFCKIVYCILTMVYNTVQELTRPMIYNIHPRYIDPCSFIN